MIFTTHPYVKQLQWSWEQNQVSKDRVAQNIVKNYLEPEWEAVFEANSYGFRAGHKYFHEIDGVDWTFCCMTKGRRGKETILYLYNIEKTPIVRHTKVKGTASPFDAELSDYWEKRNTKMGKTKWAKGSKYDQVAINQKYKCPNCGQSLSRWQRY